MKGRASALLFFRCAHFVLLCLFLNEPATADSLGSERLSLKGIQVVAVQTTVGAILRGGEDEDYRPLKDSLRAEAEAIFGMSGFEVIDPDCAQVSLEYDGIISIVVNILRLQYTDSSLAGWSGFDVNVHFHQNVILVRNPTESLDGITWTDGIRGYCANDTLLNSIMSSANDLLCLLVNDCLAVQQPPENWPGTMDEWRSYQLLKEGQDDTSSSTDADQ